MSRVGPRLAPGLLGLLGLLGCKEVPEVAYETEHLEIAPDFDHPICAGTLAHFEEHLSFVESSLARSVPFGERIRFYWITDDLNSWCSEGAGGCYFPGTRVIVGDGGTVRHELVHAVLNAESQTNYFLEEGIAELYSGHGAYHDVAHDARPDPGELLWLSPTYYRFDHLDYDVAAHFMGYIQDKFGNGTTRAIASVVITGAGPPELEANFERFTGVSFAEIEQDYAARSDTYYRGVRELDIPEIDSPRWVDMSLRCDDDDTFGPLPAGAAPGMYRAIRLVLQDPVAVDVELVAPADVRATFVDIRRERGAGVIVDFFHPELSGRREHEVIHGGEAKTIQLRKGTHLVVVERDGYAHADVFLRAFPRAFPRTPGGPD